MKILINWRNYEWPSLRISYAQVLAAHNELYPDRAIQGTPSMTFEWEDSRPRKEDVNGCTIHKPRMECSGIVLPDEQVELLEGMHFKCDRGH